MGAKEALKAYLTFGRKDRIGVIALVLLIGIIYSLPYLFARKSTPFPAKESSLLKAAVDTLASHQEKGHQNTYDENENQYQYQPTLAKSYESGELFRFDPNTLSVQGWQRLGLSERTSRTIDKYRSKGGRFYKPEDIQKIWGLPGGFYERVKNYIVMPSTLPAYAKTNYETQYSGPEKKVLLVDINEADTSEFIALPGIGSKLAGRIVNFRDKLGGFYSIEQVAETYGLPDSTFQLIKPSLELSGVVKKLDVNTATKDELRLHPYIRWNLANAIVEYRNQHGNFKSLEELKNISLVDETIYTKIVHYLSVN
jgi:competence protein ComEA